MHFAENKLVDSFHHIFSVWSICYFKDFVNICELNQIINSLNLEKNMPGIPSTTKNEATNLLGFEPEKIVSASDLYNDEVTFRIKVKNRDEFKCLSAKEANIAIP